MSEDLEKKRGEVAARDDRDSRQDGITSELLGMVRHLQEKVLEHIANEGAIVQDIKAGLARVEAKVEEIMGAFPEGGAKHRLDHEASSKKKQKSERFWEKMKIVIATFVLGGVGTWVAIVVWRAFLLGPK